MPVIAHLSDTHFGGSPEAARRTRAVLEALAAFDPRPDVVVVTGDIADHGSAQEYAEAAAVLGEWPGPAPLLLCPGNHDVREGYAALRGRAADRPVNEAHRVGGVLLCLLDSLIAAPPGERIDHGELTPDTLAWLDGQLADRAPGERAVVALHHPPVPIGISLMDPIRLLDPSGLGAVLARHEGLVALLVGHAHTACVASYDVGPRALPVLVPGGVVSTVTLDAEPRPAIDYSLPPMFAVHLLGDDGSLVTHWRVV